MKPFAILRTLILLCLVCALFSALPAQAQGSSGDVILVVADEPVAPAMAEYIQRALKIAERDNAELVVIQLNTPGGTVDAMNEIVLEIRASTVPVVVWVAPEGSMAASAGTLITLAGHVAAMAPGTSIGAASPVGAQGEELGETIAAKEKNMLPRHRALTRRKPRGRCHSPGRRDH